mgnify:FL=1
MVNDLDSFLGLGALRAVIVYLLCYLYFRNLLRKGYKEFRSCTMNSNRPPKRKTNMRPFDYLIQLTETKLSTNGAKLKFLG